MSHSQPSLSEHLLRYSAVASMTAASSLLIPASSALANPTTLNCVVEYPDGSCEIDFDDGGATPEFVISIVDPASSRLMIFTVSDPIEDEGRGFIFNGVPVWPAVLSYNTMISAGRSDWTSGPLGLMYAVSSLSLASGIWQAPLGSSGISGISGAYLGVQFYLDGSGPYYGWIELYMPTQDNILVKRIGYNPVPGSPIPAAVELTQAGGGTGLRSIMAAGLAGLSSALLWLRRRFAQD